MCSFSFSWSNATYLDPFIVVLGGMKLRPAAPRYDLIPLIIWFGVFRCDYNTFLVKTLNQWPPNVHVVRYKLLHGALVRKQHFLPLSNSPMVMMSRKFQPPSHHHWCQCGCRAGLYDFSPLVSAWLSCRPVRLQSIGVSVAVVPACATSVHWCQCGCRAGLCDFSPLVSVWLSCRPVRLQSIGVSVAVVPACATSVHWCQCGCRAGLCDFSPLSLAETSRNSAG